MLCIRFTVTRINKSFALFKLFVCTDLRYSHSTKVGMQNATQDIASMDVFSSSLDAWDRGGLDRSDRGR